MLFSQVVLNASITCTLYSWGPQIFQINLEAISKTLVSEGRTKPEIYA